jgi:hypothetical protein
MQPEKLDPKSPAAPPAEPRTEAEMAMVLEERIQRSREIINELDSLVAASRKAAANADQLDEQRHHRSVVRVVRPDR